MDGALINARAIRQSSDARALRELGAFVNSEHNSVPCFYSCKIYLPILIASHEPLCFNVSVVRRRNLAIESECHNLDNRSPIWEIGAVNLLEAIRRLVSCRTLTDVQFSLSIYKDFLLPPGFLDLMSEGFTLLRSSPSLSCFHFKNSLTDASRYCKHLQTLVCENPRLETLMVHEGGRNVVVLAEAIAVCLLRNTVLKSFTLRILTPRESLNRESLEILFRPLTSSSPSEANTNLKELALYFQYPDGYCVDAIANLVCRNTTLKKLDLRFSSFRSCLKDDKSSWREMYRPLEVNRTLEEVTALRELLVPFVPDRYGRQPNTTLSTLCLFVSEEVYGGVLKDLAVALQLNTTLKHVQFEFKSVEYGNYQVRDDVKYITDKNLWQEEYRIQEILRMMIDNELRVNTSLESLTVGHWTLLRVGTEWQTCYRGPCLREQTKEYNVKVKMTP